MDAGVTSDFTLQSGQALAVGDQFSNAAATTTWSGSTLFLYGGDYVANASTTSDVYGTLLIGSSAAVRLWNSDATTILTQSGGSLYSQDHAEVDGDLYIYGDFRRGNPR